MKILLKGQEMKKTWQVFSDDQFYTNVEYDLHFKIL